MLRKLSVLLMFILAVSLVPGFADNISFSGSGSSGSIAPGQPFAYDFDGASFEPDWGVPGVGAGLATWNGPTIGSFTITFNLPAGISIDAADLGSNCNGGASSGIVFCASPYDQPWDVTALSGNSITFMAQQNGDFLTSGDQFFINIFFAGGDPNGASFTGSWGVVPEPGSMVLFGSSALGLAGLLRRRGLL